MIIQVNNLLIVTFFIGVCIGMTATFIMYEIVKGKYRKADGYKTDSKD